MTDDLSQAIAQSSSLLEQALVAARAELAELDERRVGLIGEIERAEAMLRNQPPSGWKPSTTLHEAIAIVLREHGNRWMTIRELSDEVNERGLYRKKDGSKVEPNQFYARINNYSAMFERNGTDVRLRDQPKDES